MASCALAFESLSSRVYLAFYALFFLVFFSLCIATPLRIARSPQDGRILSLLSILCSVVGILLSLVFLALGECHAVAYVPLQRANVAITWLSSLGPFLLIVLILSTLSRQCLSWHHLSTRVGSGPSRLMTTFTSAFVFVFTAMLVATLAVYTQVVESQLDGPGSYASSFKVYQLAEALRDLWLTYYVLEVVGMLLAGGIILSKTAHLRRGSFVCVVLALTAGLGMTLTHLGGYVHLSFATYDVYGQDGQRSQEAQLFMGHFFYAVAYMSAVFAMSTKQTGVSKEQ